MTDTLPTMEELLATAYVYAERDDRGKPEVERTWLPTDFRAFVEQSWHVIEPDTPFVPGPHIDAICWHLQAMTETQERLRRIPNEDMLLYEPEPHEFRSLVITIPPGTSKSTICSVMWPTWVWTRNPSERFLTASYSGNLSQRDALKSRRLIQSDWFQERWGDFFHLSTDQNVKTRYENDQTGYRIAMTTRGTSTGERGSVIIVDDPHNVKDAGQLESNRLSTLDWWSQAMTNRLNDARRDLKVIIQQRVHEDDLAGHVLAQGGWVHLNLPMEYEGEKNETPLPWEDWRTEDGELLMPIRMGPEQVAQRKIEMGEYAYAAQYQQRPVPLGGAIFHEGDWHRYRREELPDRFQRVIVTADTAHKKGRHNDFTAIALWGETRNRWYLLDLIHKRLAFPELQTTLVETWDFWHSELPRGWRPSKLIIEDASSGTSLIQVLEAETTLPIEAYPTDRDKEAKAHAISGYQAAGKLSLPDRKSDGVRDIDVGGFIHEHSHFPYATHDDRVDCTTTAILWFIEHPISKLGSEMFAAGTVSGWNRDVSI